MSAPAGDWHYPRRRHLRLCREDAWGVCPAQPDWQTAPLLPDGYTLGAANALFSPETFYGGQRRTVCLRRARQVAGKLAAPAWPEVAGLLLEMALERTDGRPPSYCADHYTPADPRRCLGVMADQLEVTAGLPPGDVALRLALLARAEEPNAALTEADFSYAGLTPAAFRLDGASVTLDGEPVTSVEAFALRVRNNVTAGPGLAGAVGFLAAGPREVSLEVRVLAGAAALHDALRGGAAVQFGATFVHPAGHTLSIALPELHPAAVGEQTPAGRLVRSTARMVAAADDAGDDITYALNLSA